MVFKTTKNIILKLKGALPTDFIDVTIIYLHPTFSDAIVGQ